jgi:hypothetical protein
MCQCGTKKGYKEISNEHSRYYEYPDLRGSVLLPCHCIHSKLRLAPSVDRRAAGSKMSVGRTVMGLVWRRVEEEEVSDLGE